MKNRKLTFCLTENVCVLGVQKTQLKIAYSSEKNDFGHFLFFTTWLAGLGQNVEHEKSKIDIVSHREYLREGSPKNTTKHCILIGKNVYEIFLILGAWPAGLG